MEELGQFDEEFRKKQKELLVKQEKFEEEQREYSKHLTEIEAKERKKNMIISWAIIFAMFLFVGFLAWKLLL